MAYLPTRGGRSTLYPNFAVWWRGASKKHALLVTADDYEDAAEQFFMKQSNRRRPVIVCPITFHNLSMLEMERQTEQVVSYTKKEVYP